MPDRSVAPVLDMNRYVPGIINHLSNKLSRGASSLYRERFGIGIIEWRIMAQLAIYPGSTARTICEITGLDKAAVSRSLRLLEERQITLGRSGTGRHQRAALTAAGKRLHDRIIAVALERERRLLACLEPHERNVLVTLLDRIYQNLDAVNAPIAGPAAKTRAPRKMHTPAPIES